MLRNLLFGFLDLLLCIEVQFLGFVLDHGQHAVLLEMFGFVYRLQLAFFMITEVLGAGLAVTFDLSLPVRYRFLGRFKGHLALYFLLFVAFEWLVHQLVLR